MSSELEGSSTGTLPSQKPAADRVPPAEPAVLCSSSELMFPAALSPRGPASVLHLPCPSSEPAHTKPASRQNSHGHQGRSERHALERQHSSGCCGGRRSLGAAPALPWPLSACPSQHVPGRWLGPREVLTKGRQMKSSSSPDRQVQQCLEGGGLMPGCFHPESCSRALRTTGRCAAPRPWAPWAGFQLRPPGQGPASFFSAEKSTIA